MPLTGQRVLVVEDEYIIAVDVDEVLEAAHAEIVGPAANLPAAIKLASEQHIDVAVLDIRLRDADIYPLVDMLQGAGVPVVFVTGYDRATVPLRYQNLPLLAKPFDPELLISTIADQSAAAH